MVSTPTDAASRCSARANGRSDRKSFRGRCRRVRPLGRPDDRLRIEPENLLPGPRERIAPGYAADCGCIYHERIVQLSWSTMSGFSINCKDFQKEHLEAPG